MCQTVLTGKSTVHDSHRRTNVIKIKYMTFYVALM